MTLLFKLRLLYLSVFLSSFSFCFAQTYQTEIGSELKQGGNGWGLLGKKDGGYLLDYRNNFRILNANGKLQREVEVPFDLTIKEGYQKSELLLVYGNPLRLDLFYHKKKKSYLLLGTHIETSDKVNIELVTYPIKDKLLFVQRNIQNDDKTFSTYAYYANEQKMAVFQFKTFDSNLHLLNEWNFELPYKAGSVTFADKIAKHIIKDVYNIENRKVCLIVDEDLAGSGQPGRHQLIAYIYDLSLHTTDTVVLKNISIESSIKMVQDRDKIYFFGELHNKKEFVGVSTVVLNTKNNSIETDKEILFTASDKAKIVFGAKDSVINKKMIPVKMHVTQTGDVFVLYESSYMYNIGHYGSVGGVMTHSIDHSLEYVYGDIVIFSLSQEGRLKQIHKIPKAQRSSEKYRFGSFYSHVFQNRLYVFLNDFSAKYAGSTIEPAEAALVLPSQGTFMGICIDEIGAMTWKEICRTEIQKDFIIPSEDILKLDDNRILIPATDGRDMYAKKQKLMILTIEHDAR